MPSGCTTELSHKGYQFLTHIFERYDKDRDHALSPSEYTELFSTCPTPAWPPDVNTMVPTNEKGWITYQGYMCQWALMTLVDLPRTFEYLAYLGYNIYENESQLTAVQGIFIYIGTEGTTWSISVAKISMNFCKTQTCSYKREKN